MKNSRWLALFALGFALIAVGIDVTVLNLALPTLARELSATTADLQWFVDAYSLVLAALLLPAGLIGDRFGRKKLLLAALVLFGAASSLCGFSSSPNELIAGRALLGIGAAFLMPLTLSVLPVLFPGEAERRKAIAAWTAFNALSFPLGPIAGGYLLGHFQWGAVFLINVPVVVVGMLAVLAFVPESKSNERPRIDVGGIVLSSIALVALTFGVIDGGQDGFFTAPALTALAAGVVAAAAFVVVEKKATGALVDLSLFSSPSFSWGTALATFVSFAMFGVLFAVPQLYQLVRGKDAMDTGLRLLPLVGGLIAGAGVASRVAKKTGDRPVIAVGFVILAGALAMGACTSVDSEDSFMLAFITIIGLGIGVVLPSTTAAAMSALSQERSGVGSALIMALRQVGGTIGVALLGSVMSARYQSALDVTGVPASLVDKAEKSVAGALAIAHKIGSTTLASSASSAFVAGMDAMLWVCAAVALAGALLALVFLPHAKRTVEVSAVV